MLDRIYRKAARLFSHRPAHSRNRLFPPAGKRPLRCGIVGLGVMGQLHAATLTKNPCLDLAAICGRDLGKINSLNLPCEAFDDFAQMLALADLDVVIVSTPHPQHRDFCIQAILADKHVICEKPLTTTIDAADQIVAVAEAGNKVISVVSQTRFEPSYRSVKEMLDSGELGPVRRIAITETFWRSDAYYRSGSWRGTWAGEGGGVMVNQAPHVLDRYVWMAGRPDRVSAHCETVLHDIEVEDTATLILSHDNGIQGHIHISTNECPPICRMEIACDRGRVTVDQGAITIERLDESIGAATRERNEPMGSIGHRVENRGGSLLNWSPELLHAFYEDFADAIWNDRDPEVTPETARDVVEIINAAHLSAHHRQQIQIPVDRQAYGKFDDDKRIASRWP